MNRQKILALFLIVLLMGTNLVTLASASVAGKLGHEVWDFAKESHGEFSRIFVYLGVLYVFMLGVQEDLSTNLRSYVVDNPNVTSPEVMDVMGFFILNVQVAFILAIAGTGAFMLLSSQSPRKRAQSKYLIGKLIIGFLLVTISPYIMQLFFTFSSSMTAAVIDAENPQVASDTFNNLLFQCWYASGAVLSGQIGVEWFIVHKGVHGAAIPKIETDYVNDYLAKNAEKIAIQKDQLSREWLAARNAGLTEKAKKLLDEIKGFDAKQIKNAEHALHAKSWFQVLEGVKINPKPDFTFPFLMTQMFFIFMLYGLLSMRLILMMTFAVLFPITIFFTTFEPTKGIGRAMLEQTIFWTILQFFYAVSIDVIAVGFSALPSGLDYFGIGGELSVIDLTLSFFTIGACLMLVLTPLFTLSLYQRLTN